MITRLKIRGFKNLLDVDLRFGPFTCIAGLNGAGKSNVFDAIRFLHLLSQRPIAEAVQELREAKGKSADPRSLFTAFHDYRAGEIRLSADLLLRQGVQDDFGVEVEASISSVRYTVGLRLNEEERPERLELTEEKLEPITLDAARHDLGFPASPDFKATAIKGRRVGLFISTIPGPSGAQIKVHQEGHGGRTVPAPKSSRTVLGGLASSDFPTLLAVQREMSSWQTLLLEPSAMRAPSDYRDPRFIDSRGANLPAALERLVRLEKKRGATFAEIANRLSELVEDVHEIRVVDEEKTETYTLQVRSQDGVFHAARSLSDGTLRFLVLTALAVDPLATGVICLEEPENGIHPQRIAAMVELLRDIAVDTSHKVGEDNPLRQVIVNTHSPVVIEEVQAQELVYIGSQTLAVDGELGQVAEVNAPGGTWRSEGQPRAALLSPGQLVPYFRRVSGKRPVQLLLDFGDEGSQPVVSDAHR